MKNGSGPEREMRSECTLGGPRRFLVVAGLAACCLLGDANAAQDTLEEGEIARIDGLFEAWVSADGPGGAYGVVRGRKLIHARGFGLADIEHRVAFAPSTRSYIGSVAKQFVALTVLLLTRDGGLSLEADVRDFLPELPDYGSTIWISHLLHHTSGLRDYLVLAQLAGMRPLGDALTRDDALDLVFRQKRLNFEPGDRFEYCNTGYLLLALIAERASGQSYSELVHERIFDPLGMERSMIQDEPSSLVEGRAWGYRQLADGSFAHGSDRWYKVGPGALFSSVEDLARWVANFSDPLVGDEELLAWMARPPVFNDGSSGEEGAGLVPDSYRGVRVVHHSGNARGYGAEILRFPDHDLGVVVLCNVGVGLTNPTRLALRVADVVLEGVLDPMDVEPSASDEGAATSDAIVAGGPSSEAVVGIYSGAIQYSGSRHVNFFRVWLGDDGLQGAYGAGAPFALAPASETALRITGTEESLTFVFGEAGSATGLEYRSRAGAAPSPYKKVEPLTTDEVRESIGRWKSDELGVVWQVEAEGGHLHIALAGRPTRTIFEDLVKLGARTFSDLNSTFFEFQADSTGSITRLTVSDPRVHAMNLVRP